MNNLTADMVRLLIISLAVSAISMTLTKAMIFKGFRDWLKDHNDWLGELFSCPYCTSHWVSFGFVVIYGPLPLASKFIDWSFQPVIDFIVTVFATVTIAAFASGLIYRAFEPMSVNADDK